MTSRQLEENINKWSLELEDMEKVFLNQVIIIIVFIIITIIAIIFYIIAALYYQHSCTRRPW